MQNLSTSNQELFDEIVERATEEGVADQEAFNQLVESMLEDKSGVGELDVDQDIESMEDAIKARWDEYSAMLDARA
ncbi:MAG: hypothetical protein ABIA47_04315 [bacterium]